MPVDKRGTFAEENFSYCAGKDGAVFITHRAFSSGGKQVTVLRGRSAASALRRLERLEGDAVQLELTGNYKRGNERRSGR